MYRSFVLGLDLIASPAVASNHYHADPASKPAAAKLVLRDTIWSCGDAGCSAAAKSSSRPAIVCELLVKEVGALRTFTAAGQPLTPEQLERCNARAQ